MIDLNPFYRFWQIAQTGLPDLTQPQYLNQIIGQLPIAVAIFTIVAIGLGAGMALVNFSLRQSPQQHHVAIGDWVMRSTQLVQVLQHTVLVSALVLSGFLFCSTLANRQSTWDQSRVTQARPATTGTPIQQTSPQVSYTSQEPYVYTTQLNGKLVKVQDKKDVIRSTPISSSSIQVNISPPTTPTGDGNNYLIDFKGTYQITNPIGTSSQVVFQMAPPTGYTLLQNLAIEQDGKKIAALNTGEYRYPLQIAAGGVSKLRVSYQAQGSPQWVYNAKDGSLANFRMTIATKVPKLNFLSDVAPTKVATKGDQKIFTWAFNENASVQKPFGVTPVAAVTTARIGTLPLLLFLAPGIFLWWMLLLYCSIPMRLLNVAIAGAVFFVGMLVLTYFSRIGDPVAVWMGISIGLLALVWGLGGNNWRISLAAIICTIAGVIIPVYGFLVGTRGLTLSTAGLLSILWLTARNWHGLYKLEPTPKTTRIPESTGVFTRHDLLEESASYNQLNPADPDDENIAKRIRNEGATGD
jgi:hypothetical protein